MWEEKILLAQDIRNQEESSLTSEILEEQLAMARLGLGKEVSEICAHLATICLSAGSSKRNHTEGCLV